MNKKKIESKTKEMTKKTKLFVKKANKEADNIVSTLKKQWKKEQPGRERLKTAAKKTLENGLKISGDVFETIRKDVNEIKRQKGAKK